MDSVALSPYTNQESPTSSMGELRITTSTPPSTLPSPVSAQSGSLPQTEQVPRETTTTVRSRKKSKPKSQPKTRTIKFHEYKVIYRNSSVFIMIKILNPYWICKN